ncbi:probable G-protein coupled receptor 139 [Heterodontus francisci]|uniref:probable G-protein coupled receptor 139 n=1 Tax=Heterodontus francisci TaxID=7792 RepID=UPI00355C9C0D
MPLIIKGVDRVDREKLFPLFGSPEQGDTTVKLELGSSGSTSSNKRTVEILNFQPIKAVTAQSIQNFKNKIVVRKKKGKRWLAFIYHLSEQLDVSKRFTTIGEFLKNNQCSHVGNTAASMCITRVLKVMELREINEVKVQVNHDPIEWQNTFDGLNSQLLFQSPHVPMEFPYSLRWLSIIPSFLFCSIISVNSVAILILSRGKCGLSNCITHYLVAMAVADLLVVFTDVILFTLIHIHFPGTYLGTTPARSLVLVLLSAATDISVWFTVAFTFDRFVAICCPKLKTKYCTEKTVAVIVTTVSVFFCFKNIPWYFIYEPEYIIDNVPWGYIESLSYYTEAAWITFESLSMILTPFLPFVLILLLNALTVRHILVASRVRRKLLDHSKTENHTDPEMENRRKSIILMFTISGSFILLWMTNVAFFIYWRIADIYDYTSPHDPAYITEQSGYMLQLLSTCTNTCIYVVTQTKFREQLKNAVKYPFTAIVNLFK